MRNRHLLYIVGFYGTPPLYYLERYLKETNSAKLTIVKIPPVRLVKRRLVIDALAIEEDGTRISHKVDIPFPFPAPFVYLLHYFLNVWLLFRILVKLRKKRFDICIAEPSFNAALAFLLKKVGRIQFLVFMNGDIVSDYKVRDALYYLPYSGPRSLRWLAKVADTLLLKVQEGVRWLGYKSDLIWYPNDKIRQWDNDHGFVAQNVLVAGTVFVDRGQVFRNIKVEKSCKSLGYIGRLDEYAGLEMIISCLPLIRERIPDIHAHIIGGSDLTVEHYRRVAQNKGVLENTTFYGFIPEMDAAFDILTRVGLGLALYKPVRNNVSLYTDPGKVKDYIRVGLPVIITRDGPDVAKDIGRFGAGILVGYRKEEIADKIVESLSSPDYYTDLQKGVLQFARHYDYRRRFQEIWERILAEFERSRRL